MRLLLDSADLSEIATAVQTDAIAGVTTNPSLMAKCGGGTFDEYVKHLQSVAKMLVRTERRGTSGVPYRQNRHLSVEVLSLDPSEMEEQARHLWSGLMADDTTIASVDLHVKIPLLLSTLPVITKLGRFMKVNATACMTTTQAKIAVDAGASVVSFFYRRMCDHKDKTFHAFKPDVEITRFTEMKDSCPVICGSIRTANDVLECWRLGAKYVTAPMKVVKEMCYHPKTDEAVTQFAVDAEKWSVIKTQNQE